MPSIRANRDAIDDRFSVLGFTVRTDSPLFEVGIATDPALFRQGARRTRRNFYSSRARGAIRARRGEAVYLVPADVLANFVGQSRLYFGLATYKEGSTSEPISVITPGAGNMYIDVSGLTERGLRRLVNGNGATSYNGGNGADPSLQWGGDAVPGAAVPAKASNGNGNGATHAANGAGNGNGGATVAAKPYDDGYGPMDVEPAPNGTLTPPTATPAPAEEGTAAPDAGAPAPASIATPATPQSLRGRARPLTEDDDEMRGIDGPIPEQAADIRAGAQALRPRQLDTPAPEYPQASRFVPAASGNYRAVAGTRAIERVVIHITDGGSSINGTIGWFQNPEAKVSAHYVIGQDGEVVQMVRHNDVAWHARSANGNSIGIEHCANTRGLMPTAAQMCASAALATWLCDTYGIPVDRTHVLGHSEADTGTTHTGCPNSVWDWDYYMGMLTSRTCYEPPAGSRIRASAQSTASARRPAAAARAASVMRPTPARMMQGARALQSPSASATRNAAPAQRGALARAQEIITPYYDPSDPMTALTCQDDAFSQAREEWFVGVDRTLSFPHSAICQLKMTAPDGKRYQGTGFYIGPKRILTCAHNLSGMSSCTIIPGRNGAGSGAAAQPFGSVTVQSASWRVAPGYTGSGNYANDLAVIDNVPLAAPNGAYFSFARVTPSERMPIVVCGYSAGSRAVPELTAAIDGDKQHLHGGYAREQSNLEILDYDILTLRGASGSPVYHLAHERSGLVAEIVAVHVSGEPADQGLNRGCFITPDKIDWIEGRANAFARRARAQAIPLDPGAGGMSIDVAALEPGDIIVSTASHPVSYAIRARTISAVSHAMLYAGDGMVIESVGGGVHEVSIEEAIGPAILAVAYRHPQVTGDVAANIVAFARAQVGKPYDYTGVGYNVLVRPVRAVVDWIRAKLNIDQDGDAAFYCAELVYAAYANAGVPLSAESADFSAPADITDLAGGTLQYVGHLRGEDVPLGIPLSLAATRRAKAFGLESFSVHWDTVPLYSQTSNASCWAAAAAMIVGWRDNRRVTDSEIAAKVPAFDAYRGGLWPADRSKLADAWNLVAEPPASYTIDAWRHMLESSGPLYIDMNWSPNSGGHARVVVGMTSDGAADGSDTMMYLHDPWPGTPGKIKLSFADFLALYEGRVGNEGGNLQYQILHAERVPASVRPALAAPFALSSARRLARAQGDKAAAAADADTATAADDRPPRFSLAPAPEPIVQQMQRTRALAVPAAAVEIASVVAGATMERIANNEGDITWELDQLRGFKHPNDTPPTPTPPAHDATPIRLEDWPKVSDSYIDDIYAGFEVNWQYNGKSLGNVSISNIATNDAIGWGLIVKAKIMDDNIVYPTSAPEFAALRIRFEYRFTHVLAQDQIAIVDVHLFGNGKFNIDSRWEQTGIL